MSHLVQEVEKRIGDCNEIVSFLWPSQKLEISAELAKRVLFETYQKHVKDLDAVFCIVGMTKTDNRHLIKLVRAQRLTETLREIDSASSVHVHCLGPKNSLNVMNITNDRREDGEQFLQKLTLNPSSRSKTADLKQGSSLLEGTVRRPSDDERSRKTASKPPDDEEALLMSPSKRHLKQREDPFTEDVTSHTAKRKTSETIDRDTKKPKVNKADPIHAKISEKDKTISSQEAPENPEIEKLSNGIRNLTRGKKQTSITSFFTKK